MPLTILQKKYADSEEVAELGIASLAHVDVSSAWRLGGRFSKGHPGTPDNASHLEQRGSWLASTQETQGEFRDSISHGENFAWTRALLLALCYWLQGAVRHTLLLLFQLLNRENEVDDSVIKIISSHYQNSSSHPARLSMHV